MTDVARRDIASMNKSELEALMREMGEPAFRARQIFSWLHKRGAMAFCEMTDLSAALREKLDGEFYITVLAERRRQTAKDGTVKFLFELADGNVIESVLMRHDYGNSLCVSSQVGCRMGCAFCASTAGGKIRDLFASEILGQLYAAGRLTGLRIDSVVLMGIGEPLDNIQNVLRFLALVRDPDGLGMSHRHISLSTCGLADEIDALANEKLQVTLSVSLHAADDETRNRLMPVNRKYPIARLMESCKRYFALTGRRISYEYALIDGVNDSPEDAEKLSRLLAGQTCHINLILVNPVKNRRFRRPAQEKAAAFERILKENGFSATIRRRLGEEIDAACGQLRANEAKEEHE